MHPNPLQMQKYLDMLSDGTIVQATTIHNGEIIIVDEPLPQCCFASDDAPPGKKLYAAYNAAGERKGLNFKGAPCPLWEELPEDVQVKWNAVVGVLAPKLSNPLPQGGDGDAWQEVIDLYTSESPPVHNVDPRLVSLWRERRADGMRKYGQPLRRKDGRDHVQDLREEFLDAIAYAHVGGLEEIRDDIVYYCNSYLEDLGVK